MEFREWINKKFVEWESKTPNKRSTYAAFARYLGINPVNFTRWRTGPTEPDLPNVKKIAEKLGPEIYDVLKTIRPNTLDTLIDAFPNMSAGVRERLTAALSEIDDKSKDLPESDPRIDEIIKEALKQNGFKL
jgi:hypothetical protein